MGRGDKKTTKGKIKSRSHGIKRAQTSKKKTPVAKATKAAAKPAKK